MENHENIDGKKGKK